MLGCGGDVGRGMKGSLGKCVGVWEVRGDVGKGEVREMWGSVLGPHTLTHFPTPPPFLSPHANTLPHSPHTLSHTPPHTFFLISPHTGHPFFRQIPQRPKKRPPVGAVLFLGSCKRFAFSNIFWHCQLYYDEL